MNREYYLNAEKRNAIVTKLHDLLSRYVLRRTKTDVRLCLPPKVECTIYTPLTSYQVRLLRAIENETLAEEVAAMGWRPADLCHRVEDDDEAGDSWAAAASVMAASKAASLAAASASPASSSLGEGLETPRARRSLGSAAAASLSLPYSKALGLTNKQMMLRKVCVHPYWLAEPRLPAGVTASEDLVTTCGKLAVLDRMLCNLRRNGHKVLIFSQFQTVLHILQDYIDWRNATAPTQELTRVPAPVASLLGERPFDPSCEPIHLGEYRVLHGGVGAEERDEAMRQFNADPDNRIFTFLLSTRAGGLGINLTGADTVIFYDRCERRARASSAGAPIRVCARWRACAAIGTRPTTTRPWIGRIASGRRGLSSSTASSHRARRWNAAS